MTKRKSKSTLAAAIAVQNTAESFTPDRYQLGNDLPIKKITSDDQLETVANYGKAAKALLKKLEEDKQQIIDPIRKALDVLYKKQRELKKPLEAVHFRCKQLIGAYHDRQTEKAIKKAQTKAKRLRGKGETAAAHAVVVVAADSDHAPQIAGVKTSKTWVFEIEDPESVPISVDGVELRPVDERQLKKLAKLGPDAPEIPGVRFFQRTAVSI
jgi:hypothetical protein